MQISQGDAGFARRAPVKCFDIESHACCCAQTSTSIRTKYDKQTLHATVLKGHFPVCRVLIEYKADTNKANRILLKLNRKTKQTDVAETATYFCFVT